MAKVIEHPRAFEQRIRAALASGLNTAGIRAQIRIEPVSRTKLNRVTVLSKQFEKLRPSERQDLVWRIMGHEFRPEEQLRISMILTLTPRELEGDSRVLLI